MELKKKDVLMNIVWYVVIATITLLLINIFSLAKYTATADGSMGVAIAKPIIELETDITDVGEIDENEKEISFRVKNYKINEDSSKTINDVNQFYGIGILTEGGNELNFKLFKVEGENQREITLENNESVEQFDLKHTTEQEDRFILKAISEHSVETEVLDKIKIVLSSEQVLN